jgi:hypothetical protein
MGIEPTARCLRATGFEDQGSHQASIASEISFTVTVEERHARAPLFLSPAQHDRVSRKGVSLTTPNIPHRHGRHRWGVTDVHCDLSRAVVAALQ